MGLMRTLNAFLMSERDAVNSEQLSLNNEKRKCIDCLFCKVAFMLSKNCKMCFCSKDKNKVYETETFWLKKPVCKKFEDMSA